MPVACCPYAGWKDCKRSFQCLAWTSNPYEFPFCPAHATRADGSVVMIDAIRLFPAAKSGFVRTAVVLVAHLHHAAIGSSELKAAR